MHSGGTRTHDLDVVGTGFTYYFIRDADYYS